MILKPSDIRGYNVLNEKTFSEKSEVTNIFLRLKISPSYMGFFCLNFFLHGDLCDCI